jgi:AP-1 complex subunit mu
MSGISAIYFLDKKGRPIIFRNYRGEVTQDISSNFQKKVLELEESNMKPLFSINDVHYCWIRYKIYIYCCSIKEKSRYMHGIFFLTQINRFINWIF